MKKAIALVLLGGTMVAACAPLSRLPAATATQTAPCPAPPATFTQGDLVGEWVAEYFGGTGIDRLSIRDDGLYRQVFTDSTRNIETDWQEWSLQYDLAGYALLHLKGMHRCDDVESICTDPGGGLPAEVWAVNQCTYEPFRMSDEVILVVTAAPALPNGIELWHMRMGGTPYYYTFHIEQ
jgi:hypothetical protein